MLPRPRRQTNASFMRQESPRLSSRSRIIEDGGSSDDDFIEMNPRGRARGLSRPLGSGSTISSEPSSASTSSIVSELAFASDQVHHALRRGLSVLSSNRNRRKATAASELSDRFPFYNRAKGSKKIKVTTWKTALCCLASLNQEKVPVKFF